MEEWWEWDLFPFFNKVNLIIKKVLLDFPHYYLKVLLNTISLVKGTIEWNFIGIWLLPVDEVSSIIPERLEIPTINSTLKLFVHRPTDGEANGEDVPSASELKVAELRSNNGRGNLLTHSFWDDWPVHREVLGCFCWTSVDMDEWITLPSTGRGGYPPTQMIGGSVTILYHPLASEKKFQKKKFKKFLCPVHK